MMTDPLIGRTVGNYTLLQRIGRGGTSTVYRAQQTNLDREVAVKVMAARLTNNEEFINRFQREAAIIAKLQHPFILPIHDHGHDKETGTLYIGSVGETVSFDFSGNGVRSGQSLLIQLSAQASP